MADAALDKVKAAVQAASAEAEAAMGDIDDQLAAPTNLVKSRLMFAEVVLRDHDSAAASLTELINNVKDKKTKQPRKHWDSLSTIPHLQEFTAKTFDKLVAAEDCNKEQIAEALKECAAQRESVQDLAKSLSAATKDLKTAKNTRAKIKAASKKDAGGRAPEAAAGSNTTPSAKNTRAAIAAKPIFEFCTSYGSEVRCYCTEAELSSAASPTGDLDFSKPWVLCGGASLLLRVSSEHCADSALGAFKSSWATSAIRTNPGRGLQRLKDESTAVAARGILAGNLSRHILPVPDSALELTASLGGSIFAVAVGNEAAYVEKDCVPTLRMACSGSRMVCLCQLGTASKALEVDMVKPNAFARLSQAVLAATQAKVAAMGCDLHHFALGPGDVLYTPAGYLVAEAAGIGSGPRSSGKDVGG